MIRKGYSDGPSGQIHWRMLVPESCYDRAVDIAARIAEETRPGDPLDPETDIGPVISETQYGRIQRLVEKGLEEGAQLAAGGPGKPEPAARQQRPEHRGRRRL